MVTSWAHIRIGRLEVQTVTKLKIAQTSTGGNYFLEEVKYCWVQPSSNEILLQRWWVGWWELHHGVAFCLRQKQRCFFILNENMVVLHSWSACCFLVTFSFFSQARNSLTAGLAFLTGTVCRCHFFIVIIMSYLSSYCTSLPKCFLLTWLPFCQFWNTFLSFLLQQSLSQSSLTRRLPGPMRHRSHSPTGAQACPGMIEIMMMRR